MAPLWLRNVLQRVGIGEDDGELTVDTLEKHIRRHVFSSFDGVLSTDPDMLFVRKHLDETLPVLERLVRDENPAVRHRAALLLGAVRGPKPGLFATMRQSFLAEKEPSIALTTAKNIAALAKPEAEAFLVGVMRTGDRVHRDAALHALGWIDQPSELVREAILEALDHGDPDVRRHAACHLRGVSWDRDLVAEILLRQTRDADARVRGEAAYNLGQHVADTEVAERLRELLDDPDSGVRFFTSAVVREAAAVPAIPRLLAKVADPTEAPFVRSHAASGICSTGLKPEGLVEAAMSALIDEKVRKTGIDPMYAGHPFCGLCEALKHMAPESRKALPLLREMSARKWGSMCDVAIREALQAIERS